MLNGQLKISTNFYPYADDAGRAKAVSLAAQIAATNACHPAIVLGMPANDAAPIIEAPRRGGFTGQIPGPDTIADDNFSQLFAATKEGQVSPGFFTNNLYAAAPVAQLEPGEIKSGELRDIGDGVTVAVTAALSAWC